MAKQKMTKDIKLAYGKTVPLNVSQLHDFQGELKELSEEAFAKLSKEIMNTGFAFAPHAWLNPKDRKYYLVDGHQRIKTVRKMMQQSGFRAPKIPVVVVQAKSYHEAKRRVLQAASQYGRFTEKGLANFMIDAKLDLSTLSTSFDVPSIDIESLARTMSEITGKQVEVAGHLRTLGNSSADEPAQAELERLIFSQDEIVDDAFSYFRKAGFPYPRLELHEQKQELNRLANITGDSLVRSTVGYRIPDTYHAHRFMAAAQNMVAPAVAFDDDKKLRKALKWRLQSGSIGTDLFGELTLVNGTQACSNFRPAFAKFLYERYAPKNGIVFDSSTGYGGRLTGFLASHCSKYIGTDPNKQTYEANLALVKALDKHKDVNLHNSPIEDLDVKQYRGKCDLAFTSPPYFTKEIYSKDKTQSCHRYPKYDAWLQGFLRPMLQKQFEVLKVGAHNIVNIEDVTIGSTTYKLVEPTIEIAKELGFDVIRTDHFELSARTFMIDGEKRVELARESVIIMQRI